MRKVIFLFILSLQLLYSQGYMEYLTGSSTDLVVAPDSGICMMGGASESDEAMIWFLNKANGGDVVVLRASGSDGYNDYFYSQLGVTINSVRTFVVDNQEGATNAYLLDKVEKAEAIWFAGGDQFNYVSFFKDNALENTLNNFVNVKGGVIGGTSAGMAILGSGYFSAQNGTITNSQALSNPYHNNMTLGYNDFLEIPFLEDIITDTHYDDPDRRGRHSTFLARYAVDNNTRAFGIASEEFTAVCVDDDGKAYVFGEYPSFEDYAYFIQTNCAPEYLPETCVPNVPLDWNRNNEALKVYKVPGTTNGENYFDLSDWQSGSGGEWENWYFNNGVFSSVPSVNPNCSNALSLDHLAIEAIEVSPNPFSNEIKVQAENADLNIQMFDVLGIPIDVKLIANKIDTSSLVNGIYFLRVRNDFSNQTFKLVKN